MRISEYLRQGTREAAARKLPSWAKAAPKNVVDSKLFNKTIATLYKVGWNIHSYESRQHPDLGRTYGVAMFPKQNLQAGIQALKKLGWRLKGSNMRRPNNRDTYISLPTGSLGGAAWLVMKIKEEAAVNRREVWKTVRNLAEEVAEGTWRQGYDEIFVPDSSAAAYKKLLNKAKIKYTAKSNFGGLGETAFTFPDLE